jgi:hypothetical protein
MELSDAYHRRDPTVDAFQRTEARETTKSFQVNDSIWLMERNVSVKLSCLLRPTIDQTARE